MLNKEPKFVVDLPKDRSSIIKVIGVGGGGSNAVNHMFRQGIAGVDFFVCNTDSQALELSPVPNKIAIGNTLTEGLGAGSEPEIGKKAALESIEDIIDRLGVNTKMLFVTAGLGGGTGTGAAPVVAQTAKELGILTVAIVTTPFAFEGNKRIEQATQGLEEIRSCVDAILIISNDKLKEMYGNLSLSNAFSNADNVLTIAAKGIAEIITLKGIMNVDFADVKTAMTDSGVAIMGNGIAEGEDRAIKAAQQALESPLLDENQIRGAKNILLNITYGTEEILMEEATKINEFFQEQAGRTANLKWGYCKDENLGKSLSVTIIATGFESRENTLIETKQTVVGTLDMKKEEEEERGEAPKDLFDGTEAEAEGKEKMVEEHSGEDEMEAERIQRIKDRMRQLRQLNDAYQDPDGVNELHNQPAYLRRKVDMDDVKPSSEQNISRYSLFEDEEKRPEIRKNNSFLHDNVD
ncbi:MAG: cell division protein FtsZ [Bacteroidetes bacterium]|nr:cell division protein FtsZ [Bacteroidota bacterium]